jgi:hypothetical protein
MKMFSRTLSAAACALFAAATLAQSALAGEAPHHPGHHGGGKPSYHGRPAGSINVNVPQVKIPNVNVIVGGASYSSSQAAAISTSNTNVTVYGGGGGSYVNYTKVPEYIDNLEVVTVTRGASRQDTLVDAVCVTRDGREMPAARARRAQAIASGAAGELFRCENGFELRAFSGRAYGSQVESIDGFELVCGHGQSLWRSQSGELYCGAKRRLACWGKAKSSCNCECSANKPRKLACTEAQLRHAFGAGAVRIAGTRAHDHAAVIVTRGLSLNGGVGYPPF